MRGERHSGRTVEPLPRTPVEAGPIRDDSRAFQGHRAAGNRATAAMLETQTQTQTQAQAPKVALTLQRSAGNRATSSVLRRKRGVPPELTSKQLVTRLRTIPVIAAQLDALLAQGPSVLEHIERELKAFDAHLRRKATAGTYVNEAMRIATVIDAVAFELAKSVNDPTLKGRIAKDLIAANRADIDAALATKKESGDRTAQTQKAIDLAAAIVSADPLHQFMMDKVKVEDAAWKIREMAASGKVLPHEMFRMLKERFELELGSFSADEVSAGRRKKDEIWEKDDKGVEKKGEGGFELSNLIGEIDPVFHSSVVGLKTGKDKAKLPKWADGGLQMEVKAQQKLTKLEDAVSSPQLSKLTLSPSELAAEQSKSGTGLSAKQSEHFARLRQEETAAGTDYEDQKMSPRDYIVAKFVARYAIDKTKAGTLVDDCIAEIARTPLTLTNSLESLFAERDGATTDDEKNQPKYGSEYKSEPARMQHEVDVGKLVGKPGYDSKAMAMGKPDPTFTRSRGENYMRWRRDKDERETGYHNLSAEDLPAFAAVNPNFEQTKGGNANKAQYDPTVGKYTGVTYGENYYGDFHMVLKDEVRPRSTFIARGKKDVQGRRIERTSLTFLLADMCRLYMYDYVDAFVATVAGTGKTVLTNMDAEVHIYGKLDLATDVKEIHLSSAAMAATDGPGARAKAFARKHGIAVKDIGTAPNGYEVLPKQGVTGGIDLKSALAKT